VIRQKQDKLHLVPLSKDVHVTFLIKKKEISFCVHIISQ
jgi:hypothetical protein